MNKYYIKNIIFSSSATVYSPEERLPWDEKDYI
jgi:UDP-glucose 4-epimerase